MVRIPSGDMSRLTIPLKDLVFIRKHAQIEVDQAIGNFKGRCG
ncbi:Uncharacterised protein [Klebsiella pneumoniae]|nr:Uncharacterised protein [Klebsiella pneumoniae]